MEGGRKGGRKPGSTCVFVALVKTSGEVPRAVSSEPPALAGPGPDARALLVQGVLWPGQQECRSEDLRPSEGRDPGAVRTNLAAPVCGIPGCINFLGS